MVDLVVPTAPALVTVPDVELVAVGQWNASTGTTTFTSADLAACISAMDCPGVRNPVLKLGHTEEDGAGLRWDGEPTVGWIANMRSTDNDAKIVGDYTGMPGWLAGILPSAYPDRSIEMYRPFTCQIGHVHPAVITAVALLGVAPPAVGVLRSLQDVAALYEVQLSAPVRAVALRHGDIAYLATIPAATSGRRELTPAETASGMDPDAVQTLWQEALDLLLAAWEKISKAWRDLLAKLIRTAVDDGDLTALANLEVDSEAAQQLLAETMVAVAEQAAAQMVAEAASQDVAVEQPPVDETHLGALAAAVVVLLAVALAAAAARESLRLMTPGSSGDDIAAAVVEHLEGLSDRYLIDQLGGALSAAQASGRFAVLRAAPEAKYASSEVLDAATCDYCETVDGTVFEDLAAAEAAYANGAYVSCLGGLRCRGQVIAIWSDDPAAAAAPGWRSLRIGADQAVFLRA